MGTLVSTMTCGDWTSTLHFGKRLVSCERWSDVTILYTCLIGKRSKPNVCSYIHGNILYIRGLSAWR